MKRLIWAFGEIKWFIIGALHVITGKYFYNENAYGNHVIYDAAKGNEELLKHIESSEPFAYCRYSYTEMDIMRRSITQSLFGIPTTASIKWLDIFCKKGESNYRGALNYTKLMERAFRQADMIGIWRNLHLGDTLLELMDTQDSLYLTRAENVESFRYEKPWTAALKGKRVLVVSPFSEAIKQQYERKEYIWENKDILPDFHLETEDAVWYYAGKRDERFADWFEAFDHLYKSIMAHDFDVAILGCGYFGFALAAKIKEAGRKAVHMGGATQLLFGIKGQRWDNNPNINRYYNDHWIRPDEKLRPKDDKNLDDGCYW
ncbi:MAG: hypothetical protein K6E98_09065 [Lachnospiraceae bacterium]|nr:hypothetical protein [Lachnospiraceae bacterium]